jgi:hypothetical protein
MQHLVEDDRFQEVTRHEAAIQIRMDPDHLTAPVIRCEVDRPASSPGTRPAPPGDEGPDLAVEMAPVEIVEDLLQVEASPSVPEDDPTRPRAAANAVEPRTPVEAQNTPAEMGLGPAKEPDQRAEDGGGRVQERSVKGDGETIFFGMFRLDDVPPIIIQDEGNPAGDGLLEILLELIAAHLDDPE